MTITSFNYLVLVAIGVLVYYIIPKSLQWIELLFMSIIFYCFAATPYTLTYIGISTIIVWGGTNFVEKIRYGNGEAIHAKLQQMTVALVITINILMWFVLKGGSFWKPVLGIFSRFFPKLAPFQSVELVAALGMGYYTLQIIGYVLDCYWGTVKPQKTF